MLFMAILTHTPEHCFARAEYQADGKKWVEEIRKLGEVLDIKVHGAYVSPNEHTFYFVLEADNFDASSDLLRPPMLTHHSGKVSPIMTVEEAFKLPVIKS